MQSDTTYSTNRQVPSPPPGLNTSYGDTDDTGIDRKALNALADRFRAQHHSRRAAVFNLLSAQQQQVMQALPLLIHSGHAALPGYVPHVATGIDLYTPDAQALSAVKQIAKSFTQPRLQEQTTNIQALFLMGSSGTLGHGRSSDMDLWVCCRKQTHELLEKKLHRIQKWATNYNLQLHYFLVDPEDFRLKKTISSTNTPQLILDEFYRSATHLAGRFPIWWLVPGGTKTNYSAYVKRLLTQRFVRMEQVLDFGRITKIPEHECLYAGLLELERALLTPHKSIMKLLLIESYTKPELSSRLALSEDYKIAIQNQAEDLDTYYLLYKRIERYLEQANDQLRLNTLRECFISKISDNRRAPGKKQKALIEKLLLGWNWSVEQFEHFGNRSNWSIGVRLEENKKIARELQQAYGWLEKLARHNSQKSTDFNLRLAKIKTRLACYEPSFQKIIPRINPALLPTRSNEQITIRLKQKRWCLISDRERVFEADRLSTLVIWSLQNGLTLDNMLIEEKDYSLRLERMFSALKKIIRPRAFSRKDDTNIRDAEHLIVFINAEEKNLLDHSEHGNTLISNRNDPLCFSGFRHNLVTSLELIQISNTQQITTRFFNGISALKQMLRQAHETDYQALSVYCIDSSHADLLAQRIQKLLECTKPQLLIKQGVARYVLAVANHYLCLNLDHQKLEISNFENEAALFLHFTDLSCLENSATATRIDKDCERLTSLAIFCKQHKSGQPSLMLDEQQAAIDLYAGSAEGAIYRPEIPHRPAKQLAHSLAKFLENLSTRNIQTPSLLINQRSGLTPYLMPPGKAQPGLRVKKYTAHSDVYDFIWGDVEWLHVQLNEKLMADIGGHAYALRSDTRHGSKTLPYPIHISDVHLDYSEANFIEYLLLKLYLENVFAQHLLQRQ